MATGTWSIDSITHIDWHNVVDAFPQRRGPKMASELRQNKDFLQILETMCN